jgi:AhpD family alkylhydroperoxidase
MDARLNFYGNTLGAKFSQQIHAAAAVVTDSILPHSTQELVRIRASQINGSSFCTDIHAKDSARNGETVLRLNLIASWREATVFTDAERAALELTEQGTRLALINMFNRLNVITGLPAGQDELVKLHERENPSGPEPPARQEKSGEIDVQLSI